MSYLLLQNILFGCVVLNTFELQADGAIATR